MSTATIPWAIGKFDQDGATVTSRGVSCTKNGTGDYSLVLSNALGANECVVALTIWTNPGDPITPVNYDYSMPSDGNIINLRTYTALGVPIDAKFVAIVGRVY